MIKSTQRRTSNDSEVQERAEAQIVNASKSIEYYVSEYTIELLAKKLDDGDFDIPDYQREFTWEINRQSKFIESILMGLPIPFLFFWEIPDTGKLEIVDGSQRLRTIQAFMHGKLILNNLEKFNLLNGFSYNDLKTSRQRKFRNKSIRGIILSEKADIEARLDLFERINTGSKVANFAEIRRAALSGAFMQMIIDLSKENGIADMLPVSKKRENEREREELITRFFAYSDGLEEYDEKPKDFLYNYIKKMNSLFNENPSLKEEYMKKLNKVFSFIKNYFPYGFKKTLTSNSTPRARFESIAIGCHLALQVNPNLKPTKANIEMLLDSEEFKNEVRSDGANAKSRLNGRINITRNILLGV